jgi:hypothetical protein
VSHMVAFVDIVYPDDSVRDGTLAAALDEIGMELVADKTTHAWYNRWVDDYHEKDAAYKQGIDTSSYGKCLHVIRPKDWRQGDYEIGLVRNPNGEGIVPVLDFFGDSGRKLKDLVGDKGQHLGTAYNKVAIKTEAKQRGYAITEEVLPSGKIKLTATQYGGI